MDLRHSTTDPEGPLARAITVLQTLGREEEVAEIKRLLVERLQWREQAIQAERELTQLRSGLAAR